MSTRRKLTCRASSNGPWPARRSLSCAPDVHWSSSSPSLRRRGHGRLAAARATLWFRTTLTRPCPTRFLTHSAGEDPSRYSCLSVDRFQRPAADTAISLLLRGSGQRVVSERRQLLGSCRENRSQSAAPSASGHGLSHEATRCEPS